MTKCCRFLPHCTHGLLRVSRRYILIMLYVRGGLVYAVRRLEYRVYSVWVVHGIHAVSGTSEFWDGLPMKNLSSFNFWLFLLSQPVTHKHVHIVLLFLPIKSSSCGICNGCLILLTLFCLWDIFVNPKYFQKICFFCSCPAGGQNKGAVPRADSVGRQISADIAATVF